MQRRRPRDMPGGLLVTLLWCSYPAAGYHGVGRPLCISGESKRAAIGIVLRECNFSYVGSYAQGSTDNVSKPHVMGNLLVS
jgi:hypothetical protein